MLAMPDVDHAIVARRAAIDAALRAIVPDGLTSYRQRPQMVLTWVADLAITRAGNPARLVAGLCRRGGWQRRLRSPDRPGIRLPRWCTPSN
ncbi:hypothetical protein AQZ49_00270 [Novosphingobium sp. FSW06-99]|nr:hypothetical protein AQZ49_00270 [Novosphingobium sp. FSW06-99]